MRTQLAGPALFTTTTTPGLAMDGIFYYTGRGLNWDMYGHTGTSNDPLAKLPCTPDANGYNTGDPTAINYCEWCADHNKPLQVAAQRRRRGRRSGNSSRSEHPDQWCMVWRQPLSRSERHPARHRLHARQCGSNQFAKLRRHGFHSALGHDRQLAFAARLASRSCGTRTTSVRSQPTTHFPAE